MNIKRKYAMMAVSLVLLSSMMFAGSVTAQPIKLDQRESTIIYAMPYEFAEYTYYTADSYATAQWTSAVYAGLLARQSGSREYGPDLAESLPVVTDGNVNFTFTLKEGLKFENGHSLTADDVVFSYKVALTPAINKNTYGTLSQYIVSNSSITKISDLEVKFTLNSTYAFAYGLFGEAIIDQETWQADYDACVSGTAASCTWNAADGSDIVGTAGPFMFDSFDATNQVFTVVKNENYWDAENTILDKIIYLQIEDKQAAISELAAGNIDIMDAQYVPGLNELNGVDGIVETIVGDPSHQEISLNHNHPIFGTGTGIPDDGSNQVTTVDTQQARLVRQAMSHIVNRNYFVNEVMEGLASPAQTAMPSASQGFDSSIVPDPFNITRAKELMEMAGFDFSDLGTPDADGVYSQEFFNVTVLAPNTNPARNTWSAAFKDELGKIGIGLSTDGYVNVGWDQIIPRTFGYENATDVPLYPDGGFDVFFVGYSWGLDWDPSGLYTASGLCATGSCDNYYNYRNSTVEAAIADYTNELNPTARTTKVQYLQELLAEDLPVLSILYPQSHWAWGSNVAGIDALLISTSAQPWNEVSGGRATVVSSVTSTATQTNTETSTATATETNTEQVTVTAEGPIEILPILLGISSVFVTVYFRRRR